MNSMTVGELKEKLSRFPDDYFVNIEHIKFDLSGELETVTDVDILDVVRVFSQAAVALQTNVNLIEEDYAREEFKQ